VGEDVKVSLSGAHPQGGGGGCSLAAPPTSPKSKFRKNRFCRHGDM